MMTPDEKVTLRSVSFLGLTWCLVGSLQFTSKYKIVLDHFILHHVLYIAILIKIMLVACLLIFFIT